MSYIKHYLEKISIDIGFDGEINKEVLAVAEFPQISFCPNGIVELICQHKIRHPSAKLTRKNNRFSFMNYLHYCDGCCSYSSFEIAENYYLRKCF